MGHGLRILALLSVLMSALVTSGPGNRFLTRPGERVRTPHRSYQPAGGGALLAVLFGSLLMPAPALLLLEHERAVVTQNWIAAAAVLTPAPLVAFALARRTSTPWWKLWPGWIAGRAAGLLAVVVAVEVLAAHPRAPMLAHPGRTWLISVVATGGYLACWRVVDTGYWPLLLIRDGATLLLGALTVGWWHRSAAGPLTLATTDLGDLAVTLLVTALTAVGLSAVGVGGWRLRRWLRVGPPFWPRPPGICGWPPEPGDVWNAAIIHDDGDHKDRPVLVWDRAAGHATVLTLTTVDKSGRPEHYVKLSTAEWDGVLTKDAWMSLELTSVPYTDFRSRRGECPGRFWNQLVRGHRVRPERSPAPALTPRHRLYSAMNRRAGVDARTVREQPARRAGPRRRRSRTQPGTRTR